MGTWLREHLCPFGRYVAGSVVPAHYDAYARILHPARSISGRWEVRWEDIAKWSGRTYHVDMQFEAIASPVRGRPVAGHKPWDGSVPDSLPFNRVCALADILGRFTANPKEIYYCVWTGYGGLEERPAIGVRLAHRKYYLYTGELEGVKNFHLGRHHHRPPEYWFPVDKSWCVATDMDLYWTYVGGSQSCVREVLASHRLEALESGRDQGLTVGSDTINQLSEEERRGWGLS